MHWRLPEIHVDEKILRSPGVFAPKEACTTVLKPSGKLSVLNKEDSRPTESSR